MPVPIKFDLDSAFYVEEHDSNFCVGKICNGSI